MVRLRPILFTIGKINVYSWGLMLAIAVIVAILGISRLFHREGYDKEMVLDMVIIMVISGLLGGRLLYIILYEWADFLANPVMFFYFNTGGLIWYGGLIGGFLAFVIYIWKKGLSFFKIADIFAPFVALGYAIVRIGCFINGCCFGKITSSGWGVVFPYVDHFARYPTQLFSSALNLLLFILLLRFYPQRKFSGQVFSLYLIGYSIYRFIIEFWRENIYVYGVFSYAQVFAVVLLLAGIFVYRWCRIHHPKISH